MKRPKLKLRTEPSSAICFDLYNKLKSDMNSLIERNVDLMTNAIEPRQALSILLSILAAEGVCVERAFGAEPYTFAAIVKAVTKAREQEEKAKIRT